MGLKVINSKAEGDHGYIGGYQGTRIGVYAKDLWAAKQAVVAHFKPSKKNAGLVWVELAEHEDGTPVTTFIS